MKKLFIVLLIASVMLSLSPAVALGLEKAAPTPPPFARDESGAIVVENNNRGPQVVVVNRPTARPVATAEPLVAIDPDQPVLVGDALVDLGGVLMVDVEAAVSYARAGESSITVNAALSGGAKPYTLHFTVEHEGVAVHDVTSTVSSAGTWALSYLPMAGGKHTLQVTVTDAQGEERSDEITFTVSADDSEGAAAWKKSVSGAALTGDWRTDIVAIAQTQIGYQESQTDFIVDEEGVKHGYTRYGDWYGSKYGDWCATFIAFCCEYAGIPADQFPRAALVQDLMDALDDAGAGENYLYRPSAGDVVFFSTEADYTPTHVGIVESVNASSIFTIEGNSSNQVRRREYALDADEIVGYASTAALMVNAGLITPDDVQQTIEIPETAIGVGYTTMAAVNMRAEPSPQGRFVKRISQKGSEVTVLAEETVDGQVWYFVQFKDHLGYVRGDLLQVTIVTGEGSDCTCGAVADETGAIHHAADCAIMIALTEGLSEELQAWAAEVNATAEMIARAKRASSLDALFLEGTQLVHVRTGESIATYDPATGALTDNALQLVVGYLDLETGTLLPAFAAHAQ